MAAGLVPNEPQYGDIGAMREMGVKYTPETNTPTFFKPQGGRPPRQAGTIAPSGGAPAGSPPAEEGGIPAEHEALIQEAEDLAQAARAWNYTASLPHATPKVKRIAAAITEAARIAVMRGREGTPFRRGW